MRRSSLALSGLTLVAACGLARAASWTVVAQPGEYGRVAIGGYVEAPRLYAPRPLVVADDGLGHAVEEYIDPAFSTDQMPVYLWVPEFQRLHWAEYCRDYAACGVPVYFVEDRWYRDNVLRRNWTPEQRSWTTAQWIEQDRITRERFERQRFEQQREEAQRRWASERAWHDLQQPSQQPAQAQRPIDQQQAAASVPEREERPSRWARIRGFFFGRGAQAQASASSPQRRESSMGIGERRSEERPRGEGRGGGGGSRER